MKFFVYKKLLFRIKIIDTSWCNNLGFFKKIKSQIVTANENPNSVTWLLGYTWGTWVPGELKVVVLILSGN